MLNREFNRNKSYIEWIGLKIGQNIDTINKQLSSYNVI